MRMFHLIRPGTRFDFVGKRNLWVGISIAAVLGTFALLATKGLNYGIDFTGGAEVRVKIPTDWDIGKLRSVLQASGETGNAPGAAGLKDAKVQQIGEASEGAYMIRAQGDEKSLAQVAANVEAVLKRTIGEGKFEMQGVDVVGPAAGGNLRKSGFLSMFYALLAILVYVAVRFDSRYAPGAVLALFHDSVITIGVFVITQKQFDLTILAALLALIGYSNNDTIIVYDRVREEVKSNPSLTIEAAVNRAINETLGRTLLTSLMTFVTVLSLWLFGGSVIENFAFTMMIGIVVGTYSSIFVASSVVILMTHWQEKKRVTRGSTPSQKAKVGGASGAGSRARA